MMADSEAGFSGWAILELMGHRRLGGRISEATIAGAAMVRIDLPHPQDLQATAATQFYSPTAVYAITPTTEAIARAIASGAPEPVSRWELRALATSTDEIDDVVDIELVDDDVLL